MTVCTTCFGSTCWHETATMKVDLVCVCCGKLAAPVIFTWILFLRYTTPILEKDNHRLNNILIILDMLLSSVIGQKSMISSCTSPFKTERNLTWIISKNIRLYPLSKLSLIL